MKYFKTFANHSDYESYINGGGVVYPNVSICEDEEDYDLHLNDIGVIRTYVEIGGIKWATMNIGATAVTDYGKYFQWGDISGYTPSQIGSGEGQKYFGWEDYKYNDGASDPTAANMTKYNSTDGKTILDLTDDGVSAAWGGKWRLPTNEEFIALGNATNHTWTNNYMGTTAHGIIFIDKTNSSKQLFFPAAGYASNGKYGYVSASGYYWSCSIDSNNILRGRYMYLNNGNNVYYYGSSRNGGFSLRGILDE